MAKITLNATNNGILQARVVVEGNESLPSEFTLTYNGIELKKSINSYDLPSNIGLEAYTNGEFKIVPSDGSNNIIINSVESSTNIEEISVFAKDCSNITDNKLYLRFPRYPNNNSVKLVYDYNNDKSIEFSGVSLSNDTLYLYNYISSEEVNSKKTDNKIIVINSKSFENGISIPFAEDYFYVNELKSSFNKNLVISPDAINEVLNISVDSIKHGTTLKKLVNFKITELSGNNYKSNDNKYLLSTFQKSDTADGDTFEIIIKNAELIKIGNRLVKINYPKHVENTENS